MRRLLLENAILVDPEAARPRPGGLLLEGGRIAAQRSAGADPPPDADRVDLAGALLCPGFIDLHFHGSSIFAEPDDAAAAVARDAASLVRHGTTAFLVTTIAEPGPALAKRVASFAQAADLRSGSDAGASVLGIHLEGPWIAPGAQGAQPAAGIRGFEPAEGEELLARGAGLVRMVTLAPEVEAAEALQALLGRRGVVAALGHSLAESALVEAAVERGARHVTHLFNAMGPLHQRAPGLAGQALADDRLTCDLICDGAHVDPRWVRVAARAKRDGLVLITDRIDPPGLARAGAATRDPHDAAAARAAARHSDAAHDVRSGRGETASLSSESAPLLGVTDDGAALRLPDGRLAGSRVSLDRSIRNFREYAGVSLGEAVAAATLRPARVLGVEAERGTLRAGARADLAVLDAEGRVAQTWICGERVWERSDADG